MGILVFSRWAVHFYSNHKYSIKGLAGAAIVTAFILLGGIAFVAIEGPYEIAQREQVVLAKKATLEKHPGIKEEVLDTIIAELNKRDINVPTNNSTLKWTFGNAVMFAATLVTTIGFGHLTPTTKLGKALTIVYSASGLPLCLYVFTWMVLRIQEHSDEFKISLYYRLRKRLSTLQVLIIHFCIVSSLIIAGVYMLPAYLFMCAEKSWSYFDSLYFIYISVTTIGLGDYVPGKNMNHPLADVYRLGATAYIMIGVIVSMFFLALGTDFLIILNKYRKTGKVPNLAPEEKQEICNKDPTSYGTVTITVPEDNNNEEKKPLLP